MSERKVQPSKSQRPGAWRRRFAMAASGASVALVATFFADELHHAIGWGPTPQEQVGIAFFYLGPFLWGVATCGLVLWTKVYLGASPSATAGLGVLETASVATSFLIALLGGAFLWTFGYFAAWASLAWYWLLG